MANRSSFGDGLFPCRILATFGRSRLDPAAEPPVLVRVSARRPSGLRLAVRQQCPRRPGVYGMLTGRGELIYLGKAKCLRGRLLSYFRVQSREPKAGRILEQTRTIVWEYAPSEFAALLRELELIRRWQPRCNVQGQPSRRRPVYVCLGRPPAPYAFLARLPPAGVAACFGPVPAGRQAREAVRRLNDRFQLRDCPQSQALGFREQGELFPIVRAAGCLRYELGTCLGPCVAACSRSAYTAQVRAARAFLAGEEAGTLEELERAMAAAAASQEYERAAILRDKLEPLRWLRDRLERLRQARQEQAFVYALPGCEGKDLWYLIHGGRVVTAVPAPATASDRRAAAQAIEQAYARPVPAGPVPADEVDEVLLIAAWFRRHRAERARLLHPDEALAACRARPVASCRSYAAAAGFLPAH